MAGKGVRMVGAIVHLWEHCEDVTVAELLAAQCKDIFPSEGDFFRTSTGRSYRITHMKFRQSGPDVNITYKAVVLPDGAVQEGDPGVWEWRWNPRKKKSGT